MRPRMPPIPDFTSAAFQNSHSDARIQISILDGKGTLMPANRGRVTEEQAADLADYIRAFGPNSNRRGGNPALGYGIRQGDPATGGTMEFARKSVAEEMNTSHRLSEGALDNRTLPGPEIRFVGCRTVRDQDAAVRPPRQAIHSQRSGQPD